MIESQTLYKLTDEHGQTYNSTQWGENVTHSATGQGELCTKGWIHAYTHPLLAVLLNPIHANFKNPILWECRGQISKRDGELKVGCKTLTTILKITLPPVTITQKQAFGILVVKEVEKDESWNKWADDWLSGKDRGESSAAAARAAKAKPLSWDVGAAAEAAAWAVGWIIARSVAWAVNRAVESAAASTINLPAIAERAVKEF